MTRLAQVWRLDPQQCLQPTGHIEKAASVLSILGDDQAAGSMVSRPPPPFSSPWRACACCLRPSDGRRRLRPSPFVSATSYRSSHTTVRTDTYPLTADLLARELESGGNLAGCLGRKRAGASVLHRLVRVCGVDAAGKTPDLEIGLCV